MLKALLLLMGQDMDDLDSAAGPCRQCLYLVLEQNAVGSAAAVEDGHVEILYAVCYRRRHGVKRSNSAAAGKCDNAFCVLEVLVVEIAERTAYIDLVALFPVFEYPLRGVGGLGELDCQRVGGVFPAECVLGVGADGVGLIDRRTVYVQRNGYILACTEIRHLRRTLFRIRNEGEALCIAVIDDLGDLAVLHRRMQTLCKLVGVKP